MAREGSTEALWRPIAAQVSQRNHSLHRRLEVAAELVPDEGGSQERNQHAISTHAISAQSARNQYAISTQSLDGVQNDAERPHVKRMRVPAAPVGVHV